MKICKVNSLPLKDVIISLSKCLEVPFKESCGEYSINIPPSLGKGQIRGINFDNGLGIIIYQCKFQKTLRIDFTIDDIHPIKYLYSVKGPVKHRFADEETIHNIEQHECAIVASERNNGHVLTFEKNIETEIISLEIDRKKFLKNSDCEIKKLDSKLKELFKDINATKTFYHEGFYGIEFKRLLDNINKYQNQKLIRKFFLESIGLQIFVNQLIQFEDDLLNDSEKTILRVNELNKVYEITAYIHENLDKSLSISELAKSTGLNPNKLQEAFKYVYNNTVNEYITNVKLDKSLELLKNSEFNISDVTYNIGFSSKSYFSKIFKQKFKVSPSLYKKLNG